MPHDQQVLKQLKAALLHQLPFRIRIKSGLNYVITSKDDLKIRDDSRGIIVRDHGGVLTFHFLNTIVAVEPVDK